MPQFTFGRAMVIIWKAKVFNKLQDELFTSFKFVLAKERMKEKADSMMEDFDQLTPALLLSKFVQAIADLSINEIKVHMMGSTKFVPDEPYAKLHELIVFETKEYYQQIDTDVKEKLEADMELVKKIALPVTIKRAEEHAVALMKQFVKKEIEKAIKQHV
eukprot:TRINITY_DN4036_c0_g1_i3.p2 TRINITY_DN4036_c0_g1~~TRINITY_DN4036_c0_g1_i3.p2  ORF type:complete len:160 (-),score=35.77 TRINITY_DN4036_c0_g1_i3:566-1045(-)